MHRARDFDGLRSPRRCAEQPRPGSECWESILRSSACTGFEVCVASSSRRCCTSPSLRCGMRDGSATRPSSIACGAAICTNNTWPPFPMVAVAAHSAKAAHTSPGGTTPLDGGPSALGSGPSTKPFREHASTQPHTSGDMWAEVAPLGQRHGRSARLEGPRIGRWLAGRG
jgi:hypothetical protein